MLRRIFLIAWKDTYLRFSDRTLLVINLLTPLALSLIVGLAFGGASGGEISVENIPVAVVNLDAGSDTGGQTLNFGQMLTDVLTDSASGDGSSGEQASCPLYESEGSDSTTQQQSLGELFDATVLTDVEAARAAVDTGTYAAVVIIPEDFSAGLSPQISADSASMSGASVEVYANSGFSISANIVRSVVTSIVDQFATSSITIASTYSELIEMATEGNFTLGAALLASQANADLGPDFSCAFASGAGTITIDPVPLDAAQELSVFVQILVSVGSAQAVFFMLFTGQFGVQDIFYEQRQGTLQRMIVTPTPRWAILVGKLLGVLLSLVVQITLLLLSLTVIASLAEGTPMFIWGNNIFLLTLLLIAIILSVMGISVLLAGVTSTPEQVQVIGPILNATLAALGGAFGFSLPVAVAQFSPIYWAVDGFAALAGGEAPWLNIGVLFILGTIMVLVGLWLFNRRVEI